jgi:hypothetical protein
MGTARGLWLVVNRVFQIFAFALFTEHVAAPGLFLEFGDGLQTTRIRSVRLMSEAHGDDSLPRE